MHFVMQPGMVYQYPLWGVGLLLAGAAALGAVALVLTAGFETADPSTLHLRGEFIDSNLGSALEPVRNALRELPCGRRPGNAARVSAARQQSVDPDGIGCKSDPHLTAKEIDAASEFYAAGRP